MAAGTGEVMMEDRLGVPATPAVAPICMVSRLKHTTKLH